MELDLTIKVILEWARKMHSQCHLMMDETSWETMCMAIKTDTTLPSSISPLPSK